MPKRTKRPKGKLKYESVERVSRWNICQHLARAIYNSDESNDDLQKMLEEEENKQLNKCN